MATSNQINISDTSSSDLIGFGHREDVKTMLNEILSDNPNLLCIAGKLDNSDVNDYLEALDMNLHGQAHIIPACS